MLRHRRIWPIFLVALLAIGGALLPLAPGTAAGSPLTIDSSTVYSLRADQGDITVSFQATVTRNDTSAATYDRLRVPLLAGAWDIRAARANGDLLDVRTVGAAEEPYGWATVVFGNIRPGGDVRFTLNYTLEDIQWGYQFISPDYISLPVVTIGDPAKVTIELPPIDSWYSAVQPSGCTATEGASQFEFQCGGSEDVYVVALIELANASRYQETQFSVPLSGGAQAVNIRYLVGDNAWAERVRQLTVEGLPRLEAFIGVSPAPNGQLVILEIGRMDIYGYDGIFQCLTPENCRIGVALGADEQVVLHELAHFWTTNYDKRWLAEGMAEFASRSVAADMGITAVPVTPIDPSLGDFYLDDWGGPSLLTTEEQVDREIANYNASYRFFEDIKNTIGLTAIQQAGSGAAEAESLDSMQYFSLLEEASGQDLGPLFVGRVFPPSFSRTLEQRAKATFQMAALQNMISDSDLDLSTDAIEASIADWDLFGALDRIADATTAIEAYRDGRDAKEDVNLWQQLGLVGKDPQGRLDDARAAFEDGDFARASQLARSARSMYGNASLSARNRLLAGIVIIVFVPVLVFGGRWALRGEHEPSTA